MMFMVGSSIPIEVGDNTHGNEIEININIEIYVNITINIIEEEKMKYFQFKYVTDSQNNKKPQNTHLVIETGLGNLYMVDSSDNTLIIKSDDKGVTWSTIIDIAYNISALWYDRTSELIHYTYGFFTGGFWNEFVYNIDLSDDSNNLTDTIVVLIGVGTAFLHKDLCFDSLGNVYTHHLLTVDSGGWLSRLIEFDLANTLFFTITPESGLGSDPFNDIQLTYTIVISDVVYLLYQSSDDHVILYKNTLGADSWVELDDLGSDSNIPSDVNYHAIAYDGSDILYFVIYDVGDGKIYLWSYSIADDVSMRLGEFDIAIMLDRNNDSSGDTPNDIEKAFAVGGTKIYKFSRLKSGVILIQNIADSPEFTTGSTILAITDNFLFVNNSGTIEVWEQQDILGDEITFAEVTRMIQVFSTANIKGTIKLSSNQIIELYDNDTVVR